MCGIMPAFSNRMTISRLGNHTMERRGRRRLGTKQQNDTERSNEPRVASTRKKPIMHENQDRKFSQLIALTHVVGCEHGEEVEIEWFAVAGIGVVGAELLRRAVHLDKRLSAQRQTKPSSMRESRAVEISSTIHTIRKAAQVRVRAVARSTQNRTCCISPSRSRRVRS